jgi:hypothetical protein
MEPESGTCPQGSSSEISNFQSSAFDMEIGSNILATIPIPANLTA